MELKPNERACKLYPVGVKYICEFCGEGEMLVRRNSLGLLAVSETENPGPLLIPHICSKCGKEMKLPTPYPKMEWVEKEEYDKIFPKDY